MNEHSCTKVIISAPSGCGKDTIIRKVRERIGGIALSISCTTRDIRKDGSVREQEGVDYFFKSKEEFERMIAADEFLEYAEKYGDYYGTLKSHVEEITSDGSDIVILNVDYQGAFRLKEQDPSLVTIFILPPSKQELRRRLIERGTDTLEKIKKRIHDADKEVCFAHQYDYVIVNDILEQAVQEVIAILTTIRLRTERHHQLIDEIKATFDLL